MPAACATAAARVRSSLAGACESEPVCLPSLAEADACGAARDNGAALWLWLGVAAAVGPGAVLVPVGWPTPGLLAPADGEVVALSEADVLVPAEGVAAVPVLPEDLGFWLADDAEPSPDGARPAGESVPDGSLASVPDAVDRGVVFDWDVAVPLDDEPLVDVEGEAAVLDAPSLWAGGAPAGSDDDVVEGVVEPLLV